MTKLAKIFRDHPLHLSRDIQISGRVRGKAKVVVIEDKFGIKILEIVGTKQKLNTGS